MAGSSSGGNCENILKLLNSIYPIPKIGKYGNLISETLNHL
jgi:hypothetical protein